MQLLRDKILQFIRRRKLFSPGDTVIAAVSGGADSIAMLDILLNLPGFRIKVVVAHLNHMLRGGESDSDEEFVRSLAEKHLLPFEGRRVDVADVAAKEHLSLEEAGRNCRHAFLEQLARKYSPAVISLAHNKNDQAETVLIRLLRGAAGSGLAGIRPRSDDIRIVRPLLMVSRKEIESYLANRGISWREDSSNSDPRFLRNRIRHQLLPLLHDYNPEIVERLSITAEALGNDEALLDLLTCEAFSRCRVSAESGVRLDLDMLLHEPAPLHNRLFRHAIRSVKGDLKRISFRHLEAVEKLVAGNSPNGHIDLPDGISVFRSYRQLIFSRERPPLRLDEYQLCIEACGRYTLPCGKVLQVESLPALSGELKVRDRDTIYLDPFNNPFPWGVRYFRPGDRIVPIGMHGRKKLKDLFIDRKIPFLNRLQAPLLLQDRDIIWVCGIQLSERGRMEGGQKEVIRVSLGYKGV